MSARSRIRQFLRAWLTRGRMERELDEELRLHLELEAEADLTMSVCTGAFALAQAGLLKGRPATTHHLFLDRLAREFPDIDVKRGVRFVESGRIATAGGLTSGIDLALHVVERYFGRGITQSTATYMEYESPGWKT